MPTKPKKPCSYPECPVLTLNKYCELHAKYNSDNRPNASERGYNSRWRKARNTYLKVHPLCVKCKEEGKLTKATVVDHKIPHQGDQGLFWDKSNWQSLCKRCHDKKTTTVDRYKEYKY